MVLRFSDDEVHKVKTVNFNAEILSLVFFSDLVNGV